MKIIAFALACLLPAVAIGQHMDHFSQLPDFRSHYEPERVFIVGPEADAAWPQGDWDLIWIEGRCVVPRTGDIATRVREVVVAPTGTLDAGTPTDPIQGNVTVTFADGPLHADDTGQWGRGLLCFGKITVCGLDKTPWVEAGAPLSGDTIPIGAGWKAGDELLIADTRRMIDQNGKRSRHDDPYFLTEALTLDRPLAFERELREHIGPIVANLTRNVTFRSENPAGVRAHSIYADHADCHLENCAFVGMGRTEARALDETNRAGRYAAHMHHCYGPDRAPNNEYVFVWKNVVADGLDYGTKWNLVVHRSHYGLIENCVSVRCSGAAYATEDGPEHANKFISNLAMQVQRGDVNYRPEIHEGFNGAGFWFKGMANVIDGNIAINCWRGFQTAISAPGPSIKTTPATIEKWLVPTYPGGPLTREISFYQTTLSAFGNRFVCNDRSGINGWGGFDFAYYPNRAEENTLRWLVPTQLPLHWRSNIIAYNGGPQILNDADDCSNLFENCIIEGDEKFGIGNALGYRRYTYVDGCMIRAPIGMEAAYSTIVRDTLFDCNVGIRFDEHGGKLWPWGVTLDNNQFSGEMHEFTNQSNGSILTIDDIPMPCEQDLDTIYANIAAYRAGILGGGGDDTEAERQRLLAEIARVEGEISTTTTTIETLTQRLAELEAELANLIEQLNSL